MGGDNSKLKVAPSLRSCAAAGVTLAISEDFTVGTLEPQGRALLTLKVSFLPRDYWDTVRATGASCLQRNSLCLMGPSTVFFSESHVEESL